MKKQFKNYAIIWSVALIVFSMIVFLVPDHNGKYYKFGGAFWAGYILIFLAFIGQLIISKVFFKEENKDKVFLNLRMFSLSITCLVLSLIFGTALMLIPDYPQWLGAIIAFVLLGFYAIAVVMAKGAAEIVSDIGEKTSQKTSFIREMTSYAEQLVSKAKSDEAKATASKVYEAIRYSNKSSYPGVEETEDKISSAFSDFSNAIANSDDETAKNIGEKLLDLINERDSFVKTNKS
ncbi:MAG: hypothetical protein IKH65_06060 [Clostridia bacterium]|nr:hypothetical protein [Clostridia bacterium]